MLLICMNILFMCIRKILNWRIDTYITIKIYGWQKEKAEFSFVMRMDVLYNENTIKKIS